jgi:cellulose synthase/poly-beta-1,6-N-acetylglucosamine synthase-like glycosyltransferase/glycosyltransferase involved in cell wall biosynthesis/O-antigen/teichoic acid export membrane protein/peptidoglycan/xylan/chitin deacetylase (PgdA/CDA1 family)
MGLRALGAKIRSLLVRDNSRHLVLFDPAIEAEKGKGFTYKGKEFVHHNDLHHSETALYSLVSRQKIALLGILVLAVILFVINWHATLVVIFSGITILYFLDLIFNGFVIFRSFRKNPEIKISKQELAEITDAELPTYTIFCPLYKEWRVVPQFAKAMMELDYPVDKLQIIFLLEANDTETIQKVGEANLPKHFETVIVPHSHPKTKPKAMNYGLQYVRGDFVVIYDAEDIPEKDQLKKAIIAFERASKNTVCVQAKLNFYNVRQNTLTKLFTAEYSLWFDLVLPGLQSLNAPLPLGGTSNHFRTESLRKLNGWDAFNVTEDCDLGMRLAKHGFRTAIVESTTYEEANSRIMNWYNQRSRWIKGYIQTYIVHMRNPGIFLENGNIKDFFIFQIIVGGKILSMFINPLMWIITLIYFAFRAKTGLFIESLFPGPILYIGVTSFIAGNFLYLYYYMVGCTKRGHDHLVKYIFLVPFYWLGMSIAAWKGAYEVIVKPHYWAKTVHGLHLAGASAATDGDKAEEMHEHIPVVAKSSKKKPSFWGTAFKYTLSGGGMLVISSLVANIINLIFNIYLSNALSLEEFGIVTVLNTLVYVLSIFVNSCATTVVHRVAYITARWNKKMGGLFFLRVRTLAALITAGIALLWIAFSPIIASYLHITQVVLVAAFAPAIVAAVIDAVNRGYLQGNLLFGSVAAVVVTEVAVKLLAAYGFVSEGAVGAVALSLPLSMIAAYVVSALLAARIPKGTEVGELVPSAVRTIPFDFFSAAFITGISIMGFLSIDIVLVKHYLDPTAAGAYSLLSLVGKMIFFFGTLLNIFIVTLVSRAEGNGQNANIIFRKIFGGMVLLTMAAAAGLVFLGPLALPVVFGAKITAIFGYMPKYAIAILLFTIANTLTTFHLAKRHYWFSAVSLAVVIFMAFGISLNHSSIAAIVDTILVSNIIYFCLVVISHMYYGNVAILVRNVIDILSVFRPLPIPNKALPFQKRILIFNWRDMKHAFAGGAELYIETLARQWARDGHSVTLFTGTDAKCKPNETVEGVHIIRRGGFYTVYICAILYYFAQLRGKYDVIIDCENGIPFFTPLFAKEKVYCLVHHIHQDVFRQSLAAPLAFIAMSLEKYLMPVVYRNCSFITVSESSKLDMEALAITRRKIHVINPGADLHFLTPGIKNIDPLVAYVGRLKEYKSIDVLITAFSAVVAKVPRAKLIIAGEGDDKERLEGLAHKLKLEKSIVFPGRISDEAKRELLQEAWVLVNPSLMEGWGITTIEANACGTPVIAANVPGLRDSVMDGKTGILVAHGKPALLSKTIIQILEDNLFRQKLSAQAIAFAQKFSWEACGRTFVDIIMLPEPFSRKPKPVMKKLGLGLFVMVRRSVYVAIGFVDQLLKPTKKGIAVLCYHSVSSDPWRFSIDFENLKTQVEFLMKTRKPVSARDVELHITGQKIIHEPSFLLAFDDGYRDLLFTQDYFIEHGIKPVVFLIADAERANRTELDTERPLLSREEALELAGAGWDVGSHSATHADTALLNEAEIAEEIVDSRKVLEHKLNIPIRYFAYPKGKYSPAVISAVREAGYALAFSMDEGFVTENTNPVAVPRIGVDRTHTFPEFKALFSPFLIAFRVWVRKSNLVTVKINQL